MRKIQKGEAMKGMIKAEYVSIILNFERSRKLGIAAIYLGNTNAARIPTNKRFFRGNFLFAKA